MPALPLELCLEVFERSHFRSANLFPDYPTLRNLSLVCRAFGYHAQKALFRRVMLRRRKQALSFIHAIDSTNERGSLLGAAVWSLTVDVWHWGSSADSDLPVYVSLFRRCPNLVEFSLISMGGSLFSRDEMNSLAKCAPGTLRCFRSRHTRMGFCLMKHCPWITGVSFGADLETHLLDKSNASNLIEFQWFGRMDLLLHIVGLDEEMDLSARPDQSVEILGLRNVTDLTDWILGAKVLQSWGQRLRSVHLVRYDSQYVECIRKHVQNLEELILDVLPSGELLDALPPIIQHLEIRTQCGAPCTSDLDLEHLIKWIPTAQNLKVLTLVPCECRGHGLLQVLQRVEVLCKHVGAQLRVYVGAFGKFLGEQEELASGRVKSFPRPQVFSPARTGKYRISYSVEEFFGGAEGSHGGGTGEILRSPPTKRYPTNSRYYKPTSRGNSATVKTVTSSDTPLHSIVPEAASSAFTFSTLQSSSAKPSGSFVPDTAPGTFKFSFGTKPTS
ncbi:hypothetical protein FRC03_004475 [Tulasnella sp. 419]|nr:hypothetical protein FRC03_004475 [Tulasnella sp. 419]